MLIRNLNKRPQRYNKAIEIISVIIAVIFCLWILTACNKENINNSPLPSNLKNDTIRTRSDSDAVFYDSLKYKTVIAWPCNKNMGVIYGLYTNRYNYGIRDYNRKLPEADRIALTQDVNNDSLTITLFDTVNLNYGTKRLIFAKIRFYGFYEGGIGGNGDLPLKSQLAWRTITCVHPVKRLNNNQLHMQFQSTGYSIYATISENKISCNIAFTDQSTIVTYCNLKFK